MSNRISGAIFFKVDGAQYNAKGNFTYNLGRAKRDGVVGADGVHGYKETPQLPFIAGEITDTKDLDLAKLVEVSGATVTLELGNGKVIVLRDAWYAGDGTGNSEEANIGTRFEGMGAEEVS